MHTVTSSCSIFLKVSIKHLRSRKDNTGTRPNFGRINQAIMTYSETIPVTPASCERSFSLQKHVNNYMMPYRSEE